MNDFSTWQPNATYDALKKRAEILARIRAFFAKRNVLEVETPLLCHATVTDPHIESLHVSLSQNNLSQNYYLQTSPEFAMKRLLAAGYGDIYQICKAFRRDECGRMHNPEFTMLEWYRLNFDHHQLMDEMDDLLQEILQCTKAERLNYQQLFLKHIDLDPFSCTLFDIEKCIDRLELNELIHFKNEDKDTWLHFLMSHAIEPKLGSDQPTFIYDFPPSQAALARIRQDNPVVGERFEVYVKGIELANGFHELVDAKEQRKRFEADIETRKKNGLTTPPIDEYFLEALSQGFPNCAGVALGIDRLVMLALEAPQLSDVVSFTFERA